MSRSVTEEATEESLLPASAALGMLRCWGAAWPMTGSLTTRCHVPTVQSCFHEPRFGVSKPTGITIPIDRHSAIRGNLPDSPTREKNRVKCHSHPQRTPSIARLRGALIEQTCRIDIRLAKELIALRHKRAGIG